MIAMSLAPVSQRMDRPRVDQLLDATRRGVRSALVNASSRMRRAGAIDPAIAAVDR